MNGKFNININNNNMIQTLTQKKLKNQEDTKTWRMWKERTKFMPVINGALGTIQNGLEQILQLLQGHPSATELQNITLMSTAHIIRKVLG